MGFNKKTNSSSINSIESKSSASSSLLFEGVCGEHTNVILVSGAGKVGPGALPFTSISRAKTGKTAAGLDRTLFIAIEVTKWTFFWHPSWKWMGRQRSRLEMNGEAGISGGNKRGGRDLSWKWMGRQGSQLEMNGEAGSIGENQWKLMKNRWKSMKIDENQWKSMKINEN